MNATLHAGNFISRAAAYQMEYACIALCHFCDNHGPRIVTCTQTGVSTEELESSPAIPPPEKFSDSANGCNISRKYDASKRFPSQSLVSSLGSSSKSTCGACTPDMPDNNLGFVSSQNNSVFISKHLPTSKDSLHSLRKACCRCYNSEQTAKKEGEVVFGDPSSDYVLSYKFYLKDTHARGLKKLYSIIVLTHTPAYLYQFSSCITKQLEVIITGLKEKSDLVYAREDSNNIHRVGNRYVDPDLLIRARATVITQPRPLSVITGDPDIFHFIHCKFSSLLKTHLPPTLHSLNPISYIDPIIGKHQLQHVVLGKHPSSSPAVTPSLDSFSNLRHLSRTIGGHIFDQLLYHLYTGHQVVIRGESQSLVSSALHHLSSLLPEHCVRMYEYEKRYQSVDRCNLLGLHLKAHLPNHFFTDTRQCRVILDIFQLDSHSSSFSETDTDSGVGLGEDPLDNYAFQIQPDTPLDYHSQLLLPTVLTHLHNIIYPKIYSEDVVRLAIDSTKQSILTKVAILKKCALIPTGKHSQLQQLLESKLLAVINASKADLPFLEFWSLPYDL
ncbi:Folliculin-like [Oopsacas minuta]|uniref:Folliculin n=1 Tax=Oopsacas minuta TaxID=111878 RepID=A0AAV7JZA5_9METZ|nr:Folliculin-like [Oopsacas minuta]